MIKKGVLREHSSKFEIVHIIFEIIVILFCLVFSAKLHDFPWNPHFSFFATIALVIYHINAKRSGLYRSWRSSSILYESGFVFRSWFFTIITVLVIAFLSEFSGPLFHRVLLTWFACGLLILTSSRILLRSLLHRVRRMGLNERFVVIAGAGDLGIKLADVILNNKWMGFKLLWFYDDFKPKGEKCVSGSEVFVKGDLDDLVGDVAKEHIDYVYLALPTCNESRMKEVLKKLADTSVSIYIVPDIFTFELLNARLVDMDGIPTISVSEGPFNGINGWIKRIEDLFIGSIITVLISPILIIIALAIKLSSKTPVIFRQKRYGFNGEEIVVWKFRTMTVCEDGQDIPQTSKNDPRVTPFGNFLRKTSLDELPQFINVIQGRMSIVGPRPHAVTHNEYYRKLITGYMLRHKVKPGITGWAQVNGWRGETDTTEKMRKRVEFDLDYIRNWSLWLDLKIIFMTVFGGFGGKNAY